MFITEGWRLHLKQSKHAVCAETSFNPFNVSLVRSTHTFTPAAITKPVLQKRLLLD